MIYFMARSNLALDWKKLKKCIFVAIMLLWYVLYSVSNFKDQGHLITLP